MAGKFVGVGGNASLILSPSQPHRMCIGNPGAPGPSLMGSRCAYIWEGHPRN